MARVLTLAKITSTTRHLGSAYPWHFGGGIVCPGPLLGIDRLAGNAPFTFDPFGLIDAGIANNPNVIVAGAPGGGKSTAGKAVAYWLAGAFGYRFVAIDVKHEYAPLADALDIPVLDLHPGGTTRINPLVSDGTFDGDQARLRFVAALAAVLLERSLTKLEAAVLADVIRLVATNITNRQPLLRDVLHVLRNPPSELLDDLQKERHVLLDGTDDLRYALRELVDGALAGMFDAPTNITIDTSRGVVIDLSGTGHDDELLRLAMLAGTRAVQQLRAHAGARTIMLNDETWRLGTTEESVRFLQHSWKLGRQHGTSNWALVHRFSDLGAQADDGTALSKMGKALIGDSDTHILFRQGTRADADQVVEQLQLPPSTTPVLLGLPTGRALIHAAGRLAVVDIRLTGRLRELTFTNQALTR
jgi:type IV secretory pathway VirB4 component